MEITNNRMLITGGGSGIGRELARRFQALGNTVIVAGRRKDALDETISGRDRMTAVTLDVSAPGAVAGFVEHLAAEHPDINVLIHCAGVMRLERLREGGSPPDAEEMVATNLLGVIRLTQALVGRLVRQPGAAIVTVSSGLGFVPLAAAPTYSATKAAVHAYTLALREQLKGAVEVIELVPPAVQTELTPGQSTRAGYLPLDAFIDETMALFAQKPTPADILVERAVFFRQAERESRFDQAFATLNAPR